MGTIPFEPGIFYHVFNRGNNKENLFVEEKNYSFFLGKVAQHLLPICNIYAYCLMRNHFHFIIEIKSYDELPLEYLNGKKKLHQPFSNLFNAYTKVINKAYGRTGSLFQEHLGRNLITNEDYLRDVIMYVHLNPVKHGFTEDYQNFTYSSFKSFKSNKPTHIMRNEVVELYDDIENFEYCHKVQMYRNRESLREIEEFDL